MRSVTLLMKIPIITMLNGWTTEWIVTDQNICISHHHRSTLLLQLENWTFTGITIFVLNI